MNIFNNIHPAILKIVIAASVGIGVLAGFGMQKYLDSKVLRNEADVQKYLLGVWTHAQPTKPDTAPFGWERWTFTQSHLQIQTARPSETQWGSPSFYAYEITRKKTEDTGEWYWHVHMKNTAVNAAVVGNSRGLLASWGGSTYRLLKEDKDLAK